MVAELELQKRIAELEAGQAEMSLLQQMSRRLNAAHNDEEVLNILSQPIQRADPFHGSLIYIELDQDGKPEWAETVAHAQWRGDGPSTQGMRFHLADFPLSSVWMSSPDKPLILTDVANDPSVDESTRQLLLGFGSCALVALALVHGGRWVGIVVFNWDKPRTFSQREIDICHSVMDLAAPVIENRRLVARLEKFVAERTSTLTMFRTLADNAVDAIVITDMQGNLSYANRAAHLLFGYDYGKQEMLGMSATEGWPEEDAHRLNDEVLPGIMQGGWRGEARQRRKDGSVFDALMSSFMLIDESGAPVGAANIVRDITDRKQAEESLRVFRTMADNAPYGVTLSAGDGTPLYANRGMHEMLGYDFGKQELSGFDLSAAFSPDQFSRVVNEAMPVLMTEGTWSGELRYTRRNGTTFDAFVSGFVLRNGNGESTNIVTLTQDITELKRAEEVRQSLQQEVLEAQKRAIQELSTPIIPIMDQIIVMPLIGSIDTMRSKDVTRALLRGISDYRAKVVILDVTGVPIVDSGVAGHLDKTIQAARLKGARTIVTGISDAVAEAIVDLGIDWSGIETLRDLQTGLIAALGSLGVRLSK